MNAISSPFVVVTTPRLVLRRITDDDEQAIWAYASDPEVTRFTAFACHQRREDTLAFLRATAKAYADGLLGALAIVDPHQSVIGTIGLSATSRTSPGELGWVLRRSAWGQGYASEALRGVIDYLFGEVGMPELYAHAALANPASIRVMEKAGMHRVLAAVEPRLLHGQLEPIAGFALTHDQWRQARIADDRGSFRAHYP